MDSVSNLLGTNMDSSPIIDPKAVVAGKLIYSIGLALKDGKQDLDLISTVDELLNKTLEVTF